MQTNTTSGADEVLAAAAEGAPEDPLDALLRQIVGGYFVLTDGQGSVSKWSEPAELLFGRPAQEVLGQSFFETLLKPPLAPAAQAWRHFLETAEAPEAPGRVEVEGLPAEGDAFPLEAVFVPVKLDEGFDFSLFLEDLSFELPINLMLLRMRQQHPVVVRALRQAIEDEPQPWDGWRTAGTLIVFRPLAPTPWVEQELAAREAARAEAEAEVEQRIIDPDPGIQGSSVHELDDAAAVVGRLLSAMERIDDLERMARGLPAQVEDARRDAEESRTRAEAAEREAQAVRGELEKILAHGKPAAADDPDRLELLARMDRLERAPADADAEASQADGSGARKAAETARAELEQRLNRLEADSAEGADSAEAKLTAAIAAAEERAQAAIEAAARRAEAARTAFEARLLELETTGSGSSESQQAALITQLERVRAEHEEAARAARGELAETLERIERERGREAEVARAELAAALERVEHVQRDSDALREQLSAVTVERHATGGLAGDDRRRLDELQRDAEQSRARLDALREHADELRGEAAKAREEAAQVRTQLGALTKDALTDLESVQRGQDELRSWLETAQREREAANAAAQAALAQLDELRSTLEAKEDAAPAPGPSVQGLEREEVTALVGEAHSEIQGLRKAEEALRSRLDALGTQNEAAAARLEALAGELAGTREEASAGRDDAREAQKAVREMAGRLEEIDRGAGNVLANVRAVRERVDEVATVAKNAHEAVTAGRADADEVRAAVARLGGELEVARGLVDRASEEALGAREQAATAFEAAGAARDDAGKVREDAAAMRREVEAGRERLSLLGGEVERLGEALTNTAKAAEAARTEATAARRTGDEVAELVAELDSRSSSLRAEVSTGRERLQSLGADVEKLTEGVTAAGAAAEAARAAGEEQGAELRKELAEVRAIAQKAAEAVGSMRADVETVRDQTEAMRKDSESAREIVKAGEQRLEAMGAEVTFALKSLDDLKAGLTSAGQAAVIARREAEQAKKAAQTAGEGSQESVTAVFQQILGLASRGGGNVARRPSTPHMKKPDPIKRDPRHGFDDVTQPMAVLNLEGKFRELNPAFARLVGYQEHEFAKAAWPSPHDRSTYVQQQEELSQLASGEIESVPVQSTYMHGQGLMVPVTGKLSVVPGEDGLPLHLLLEAEDRHHS